MKHYGGQSPYENPILLSMMNIEQLVYINFYTAHINDQTW